MSNQADRSPSRLNPVTLAEEDHLPLPAGAAALNLVGTCSTPLQDDRIVTVDLTKWTIVGGFATGAAPDSAIMVE